MDWNKVESEWDKYRAYIHSNWLELTPTQLEAIAGKRERLAEALQQTYQWTKQEAELHITEWEQNFLIDNSEPNAPSNPSTEDFIDAQNTEESQKLIDSVIGSPFHKGY